jgi:hypothetical protein
MGNLLLQSLAFILTIIAYKNNYLSITSDFPETTSGVELAERDE